MSNVVKHNFTSAKSDGADVTKVQPSNWNAEHNFAGGATGSLLAYDNGQSDKANWLADVAVGQVLTSGGVGAMPVYSANPAVTSLSAGANPAGLGELRVPKGGRIAFFGQAQSDDHITFGGTRDLASGTPTALFAIALPTLFSCGGIISYTIIAKNATDVQAHSGVASFAAVNKGGVYTSQISEGAPALETTARSTGTLTDAWTMTSGVNSISVLLNATSSLGSLSILRVYYKVDLNCTQAPTLS